MAGETTLSRKSKAMLCSEVFLEAIGKAHPWVTGMGNDLILGRNSWIVTGKQTLQNIPPLGGSGITVGLFWGAVWITCDRQVIFYAGYALGSCALQRGGDLGGRQSN